MKTDNWLVVLWHRGKVVIADSLDRLTRMAGELRREGRIPDSPMSVVSAHTSARAADRAAEKLAMELRRSGWWYAPNSTIIQEEDERDKDRES